MNKWVALNNEVKIKKDGQFQFDKDKEAVHSYFVDYVNNNMVFFHTLEEKLNYLFENDYYKKDIFDQYTMSEIKSVYKVISRKEFRFKSYMSAFKFYNNYALRTDDGTRFLERYEDRIAVNALFFGEGNVDKAKEHALNMINQDYQPATPSFLNIGRKRSGEFVSCFLLDCPDSTEGIEYVKEACAQLSRRGGGVGINLSKIRAEGEAIKGIANASSGVVGVAKMLEATFNYYNQLGQRNGSGVGYLNIFHADIEAFLDTKKVNADDNVRLKTLSIGVTIPSKFFELAEAGRPFYVFYPHTVFDEFGVHLDDMDMSEWYDKLVDNKNVRKRKLDPRKMLVKIAQIQQESGYPYLMFVDNANRYNALKRLGRIIMSNLCSEIFQVQLPSIIRPRNAISKYGYDISCVLGSLNIDNIMRHKSVREATRLGMDALNTVAKNTSIDVVPTVKKANDEFRSVGLGAMNLNGYLARNHIMYESDVARDFANTLFMMINFYSLERSMEIAVEESFRFKGFEESTYADGTYFDMYLTEDFSPKTEKAKKLFDGMHIPTKEDWARLKELVMKNGLANSYRMALAPTGNISYVQGSTQSVMPITEQIESRTYGDSVTQYPMPFINNKNFFYYKPAYEMDMFKVIDMIATIQRHVDQGISTTMYIDSNKTTRDLARYYIYAHKKGLKSLYYTRTRLLSVEECISCSV